MFLFKLPPNINIYFWIYELKCNIINIYPSLLVRIWKIDWTQEWQLYFVLSSCMNQRELLFLPYFFHFPPPWGTCGYGKYWELGIHWTSGMLNFNWLLLDSQVELLSMEFIINQIRRLMLGLQINFGVIRIQMVLLVGLDDIT